jgi:hypothetical protein
MEGKDCFIVMPFGVKQFPDGSGRTYDFDKVYRVIIQRAVREARMDPIRADERLTSALIHTDMFRDLRDRAVVLADLSLDNPNVFYELGMRHVMSSSGTVLICRNGSTLPFDIKLSRVIFYDFDGKNIDWEEVENVVPRLKLALEEAKKGLPDSPVHALLPGQVVRIDKNSSNIVMSYVQAEDSADAEPLAEYQKLIAKNWYAQGSKLEELLKHSETIFGSRALAYLCLSMEPLPKLSIKLANNLNDAAQDRLANELYERIYRAGTLNWQDQLAYASCYSEANPDLDGVGQAIALAEEAFRKVKDQYPQKSSDADLYNAACLRRLAGLQQWRWQLSHEAQDLDIAISTWEEAIQQTDRARDRNEFKHPGFLAQARLKQLLLLRIRDQNRDRPDGEGHLDAILALRPQSGDDPRGLSYLGWYQAIALADLGDADQAERKALKTFTDDSKLGGNLEYIDIGRRQYVQLRRFLDQYFAHLRNPSIIGRISQILQAKNHP